MRLHKMYYTMLSDLVKSIKILKYDGFVVLLSVLFHVTLANAILHTDTDPCVFFPLKY